MTSELSAPSSTDISRQRTLPYLPPAARRKVIKTPKGAAIQVDQEKVEDKDRILKRGQKIHKRLEREIHPEEVIVSSTSVEETWAIRMLNMLSSLEALISLGKCREMPICGFVGDVYVSGIIDEIERKPIELNAPRTPGKVKRQSTLNDFYGGKRPPSHRLIISDSKTRAKGTLPNFEDTRAGQYQVMLYKELLDALMMTAPYPDPSADSILPTSTTGGFAKIFEQLDLNPGAIFSDGFLTQASAIIVGNGLRWGANNAKCLLHLVDCWEQYVQDLGLDLSNGKKERASRDELQLVFRRAGHEKKGRPWKRRKKGRYGKFGKRRSRRSRRERTPTEEDGDADIQKAIHLSLLDVSDPPASHMSESQVSAILDPIPTAPPETRTSPPASSLQRNDSTASLFDQDSEQDREDDELALAIEMSLTQEPAPMATRQTVDVPVMSSQGSPLASKSPLPQSQLEPEEDEDGTSGAIIGRLTFAHDPKALADHLAWALGYWHGEHEPQGVPVEHTKRCAWCEFEDGCEWRAAKAREMFEAKRKARNDALRPPPAEPL